ncbi:MAG: hypothetical protein K6C14_01430 [Eubacterium sp.]|nr:hypothetical protein [Eubacterium sp.]
MDEIFLLDKENLQKGWGAEGQYWFSYRSFVVRDITHFADIDRPENMSESEFLLSLGYIPYFRVSRIELAKAYINAVGSRKLKEKLAAVPDEDYIETFWKYFNAYKHLSEGFEEFQNNYLIKKGIDWCEDNAINFRVV